MSTEKTPLTDTDRINAIITLHGGHYCFQVGFRFLDVMGEGRASLDTFIFENPSLLGARIATVEFSAETKMRAAKRALDLP